MSGVVLWEEGTTRVLVRDLEEEAAMKAHERWVQTDGSPDGVGPLPEPNQRARHAVDRSLETNDPDDMDVAVDACLECGWTTAADILRIRARRARETAASSEHGQPAAAPDDDHHDPHHDRR